MRRALVFLLSAFALAVLAQDDEDNAAERAAELDLDNDALRCIQSVSIRRIRAIDDSTIAFFLSGGRVYLNYLPRRCLGAARYERFAFETNAGRLCRMDRISVIYDLSGTDTGLPCPLGEFHPAEAEAVDLMLEASRRGGAARPVTGETVELPPEDEDETEAEASDSEE